MNGLYALKPWYADRLARLRSECVRRQVNPATLSWAGVALAAGAGASLALLPAGPVAAAVVAVALGARLACANLDGGVARAARRSTPWGRVVNELSDRLADLAAIAGLVGHAAPALVATAALAATLPSWVALAAAAAGAERIQGGPVGKTERCLLLVVVAAIGHADLLAGILIAGSIITATLRAHAAHRRLAVAR